MDLTILLKIDQKFGPLEIARSDTNIVFRSGMIELSKTPIDKTELSFLMIDHDVVGFYVTVHDPF
jgi:hypothetical protein